MEQAIGNFLNNLFSFLYNIPYCADFYIFVIVSKAFRQELKRSTYKICRKDLIIPREEKNKQENVELNVAVVNYVVLPN